MVEHNGDWAQYRRMFLAGMERLERNVGDVEKAISDLRVDVAMLQVKSGVWGLMGGLIVSVAAILVQLLMKQH